MPETKLNTKDLIGIINVILPILIALYKELRDGNPEFASFTDADMEEFARLKAQDLVDAAKAQLTDWQNS